MQVPLQIAFHGIAPSDALASEVRRRAAKLERFHEKIVSCKVHVEFPGKDGHYHVHIDLIVPEGDAVVARDHSDRDLAEALRVAFDAAARQLENFLRRQRSRRKPLMGTR
jgi:ribosomal subunit interface protein